MNADVDCTCTGVLDGVAGVEMPTSTTKSQLRFTRPLSSARVAPLEGEEEEEGGGEAAPGRETPLPRATSEEEDEKAA